MDKVRAIVIIWGVRFLMLNWRDPRNPLAGGAERVSRAYLSALARRGHEVFWFANHFSGALAEEETDGIHLARGGGKGTSIVKAIQWYRQQPRFDLVIDQHHGIPWYAPWWCGTNCLAYIHEVLGPIWPVFYPGILGVLGRWQERRTHRLYRNVPFWVPSESTRQSLLAQGVRTVTVHLNGCDTVPLPALEAKPPPSPFRLAAVSRLAPNKRVDHALHTLRLLLDQGLKATLTIVGAGEAGPALRQLTRSLALEDQVVFTGALPEDRKNEVLRQAHLLVHASVREGWGLNVVEANAMGTPAVVYPVAGLVDSTIHGQTGLVVTRESPEALAVGIRSLLDNPAAYETMRHAAWNRAKALQWERVLPPACDWLEKQAGRSARR